MFPRRKTYNQKRTIAHAPLKNTAELCAALRYVGNAEHKRNPGDFGLPPPLGPRRGKTLCDVVEIFDKDTALELLKDGIRRGLISEQKRNGFPQNIWAVSKNGTPLEAQLGNIGTPEYHGYPMPVDDPLREDVLKKWKEAMHDEK
jgi:hypothetical protein